MNTRLIRASLIVAFISVFHFNCNSPAASLLSTLGGNANLSTITTLLKAAGGLGNLMGNKGPFTLLAPGNNAFASLGQGAVENLLKPENKGTLTNILKNHLLPGNFSAEQIKAGGITNALGTALNLGGATITESIPTKGGLIQVIDKVLQ